MVCMTHHSDRHATRRVVGWATADHLRTDLVAQALRNAITNATPGTIFHSARGCHSPVVRRLVAG
jgi:transposase InsO family protein